MKKTIITLLVAGTCAMGADLVAEWDGFGTLTSTVGGKTYSLDKNASYCSVTNGVLSVSNATSGSSAATATVDLSAANLTMDNGITISLTLSNQAILAGQGKNPAGVFGLATEGSDFSFLAAYYTDFSKYALAYNGSVNNVTLPTGGLTKPQDANENYILPTGDTPVTLTLTIKDTEVNYYVNGNSIGVSTFNTTGGDLTASKITTLSLGSWVGTTENSRSSAKFYDLAVYNGAMTATEVKALMVPEPTTATLSLLALAGLAARRRRR